MDNVSFQEEESMRRAPGAVRSGKGMTGYLIAKGWVKDEKGANTLLLIVAALCMALAVGVFMMSQSSSATAEPLEVPPGFQAAPASR